jgi:aspartate aminotransferase
MVTTSGLAVSFSDRISRIEPSATLAAVAEGDKLRAQGVDLVYFAAGEPHFATPQHIKDAAIAAIQANFTKYTAVGGIDELRDAIGARHAADFGSNYKRDEVVASVGGKHALFNIFQVLLNHGDEVIIPVPYWVSFKDIVQYSGGECVFVETDEKNEFALAPGMLEKAITPRTKVLLLNFPSNPSGATLAPEYATEVVRMAAKRGIWVLSDECYVYLDYTGRLFSVGSIVEARERVIVVGSLSKTYSMTGWRLGYAMGPAPLIKQAIKLQSQSTSNPTSIVQKAAVAALRDSQQCVADFRVEFKQLRDQIVKGLRSIPGIQCTLPQGAFYVFPNVSSYFGKAGLKSPTDVFRRLLHEANVVTVPGEAFGSNQHIRLSYATSASEIDRGLERMRKFFASL